MPERLHVGPVLDNAVLHRVVDAQQTAVFLERIGYKEKDSTERKRKKEKKAGEGGGK